jgi:acyl carrier protein
MPDKLQKLHFIIQRYAPVAELRDTTRLCADLHLDGAHLTAIACDIEDEFGVLLPDDDLDAAATVGDLRASLDRMLG